MGYQAKRSNSLRSLTECIIAMLPPYRHSTQFAIAAALRNVARTLLEIGGLAIIATAAYIVHPILGMIVSGVFLLLLSWVIGHPPTPPPG